MLLAGWLLAAGMVALLVTQFARWTPRGTATAVQAVTPYLLGAAFPLGAAALVARRWTLSAASLAIAAVFVGLAWPLRFPPSQPDAADGATTLRVFSANLLYSNGRTADVVDVIDGLDVDVVTFSEYTPEHAGTVRASPLADSHRHRVEHPTSSEGGTAIWSRYPITAVPAPASYFDWTAVRVGTPEPVVVMAVHVISPLVSFHRWRYELGELAAVDVGNRVPVVMIGDFNGGYWHPRFRELLDAGWTDAHIVTGDGFSNSWPTDVEPVPPFTRLDHALVDDDLVVLDIDDVDVPGSDHRGLVVDVAVAATAGLGGAQET